MEENKKQTLREFLDSMNVNSGDDRTFILYDGMFSQTEMQVSRRYIESEPWKYLLDKYVWDVGSKRDMYGNECLAVVVEGSSKDEEGR